MIGRQKFVRDFGSRLLQAGAPALVLLALATGGCTTAMYQVKADPAEPEVTLASAPQTLPGPYRMQVGDLLNVRFYRNPDLDQEVMVRPDGMISLPYLDDVAAAGYSPAELDAELTRRYTGELANPDLTVIVVSFGGQKVYVGGEVTKEGVYDMIAGLTVFQAITLASGFNDFARRDQVVLIRRDAKGRPSGRAIDLRPVANGEDTSLDVPLQPYDIVHVPRSAIGNVTMWVNQYVREMLPINPSSVGAAATSAAIN